MSKEIFYELSAEGRNKLIAFHGKAEKAISTGEGFSGVIVFLDNVERVSPRNIVAKYPKFDSTLTPGERAWRFLRELQLQTSAYYHPNVHWPFKACMIHGAPVAYFRRWEGDLSHYIESPAFGDIGRIMLIIQLVAGLRHCLARGLVHQDLKPENVFVRDLRKSFKLADNDFWLRPMVADFGSVNLAAEKSIYRSSRPYMAPEQWGKSSLGERTNVFVIGVMLHELISRGEHPLGVHGGPWHREQEPLFKMWQQDRYWKRWVVAGCPVVNKVHDNDIAEIVADCLEVKQDGRPTLAQLEERLKSALANRSCQARKQLDLFLDHAKMQTEPNNWAHLTEQLAILRRAIENKYPKGS
jgi:serine/threonine protein kinase